MKRKNKKVGKLKRPPANAKKLTRQYFYGLVNSGLSAAEFGREMMYGGTTKKALQVTVSRKSRGAAKVTRDDIFKIEAIWGKAALERPSEAILAARVQARAKRRETRGGKGKG